MKYSILMLLISLVLLSCGSAVKEMRDYTIQKDDTDTEEYTFEVYAPEARKVYLAGEMTGWDDKTILMDQETNGFWRKTLYLDEGKWNYKFVIDGEWFHDTNNPNKISDGFGGYNSYIIVGDMEDDSQYQEGIPHGTVTNILLKSEVYGFSTTFNIYLPPQYESHTNTSYPLLFLLHGMGEDEYQWVDEGLIENYMDNYLNAGAIQPFIIVMPSGGTSFYTNKVETFITTELYVYMTNNYRIKSGKSNTAISGLSMGGFGAFYLAQRNQDMFGISIPLSGYFDYRRYLKDFNDTPLTADFELYIFCGYYDTICYDTNLDLLEYLDKYDIEYEFYEEAGGHTWRYWNRNTPDMLKLVSNFFYD